MEVGLGLISGMLEEDNLAVSWRRYVSNVGGCPRTAFVLTIVRMDRSGDAECVL